VEVEDLFANVFQLQAEIHQDLCGDAFLLTQETEKEVLGADVIVI
jgi:hypothetical protein